MEKHIDILDMHAQAYGCAIYFTNALHLFHIDRVNIHNLNIFVWYVYYIIILHEYDYNTNCPQVIHAIDLSLHNSPKTLSLSIYIIWSFPWTMCWIDNYYDGGAHPEQSWEGWHPC